MGLDNGILLKTHNKIDMDDWEIMPDYTTVEFDEFYTKEYKDGYYYEVCYWRKYWGLRNDVMRDLGFKDKGGGRYEIENIDDLKTIIEDIEYYFENPDEWQCPVWTIDEAAGNLAQTIINLSWLCKYKEQNPSARIIFYDSY